MQATSDVELLREYATRNSETAFEALVSRHVRFVYSAALRQVRDPHLAGEVTQAVFIILAQKAGRIHEQTILSGWFFKTTRFVALAQMRALTRRHQYEKEVQLPSEVQPVVPDPAWEQMSPLLDEALAQLGQKDRQALLLRFFENKSLAEVGNFLGTGEDTARMRIGRALEKLRRHFLKRGVASTPAIIADIMATNSVQAAPMTLTKSITAVAMTKGVAASGSTLTLIKGALKLMAWTKTKITIVTGVAILAATGTTMVAVKAVNTARTTAALATMQGNWEGIITANQAQLRLVLRIFKTNDTYRAVIDSVDQGAKNIPVTRLLARKDSIHAELPALNADYQATLNADGTEMSGTWKQLNQSFPLRLTRTTEAARVAEPMAASEFAPRADSDLQGAWQGTLKVGNVALRLNLKIAEPTPGTFHAQLDSVDQGIWNLPITSLTYDKPTIRFEMRSLNGVYEGDLDNRDDQMTGTWTQMGKKLPLTFQRARMNSQTTANAEKDYGQGASYQVQGHWKGVLNANNVGLHIVFNIALMPDGSYSATLDSPDQGASGIPATTVQFTYPNLRMEWSAFNGVFTGKLANGKLSGTWSQGKTGLPLQLERDAAK
jgi:RNA polymerase sigma factor (sigma-70 family)